MPDTGSVITDLQTRGMRMIDPRAGADSRRGGAGPTDHKAVTIDGLTVMIPVHTHAAFDSPYIVDAPDAEGRARVTRDGTFFAEISFPKRASFLDLATADGIPYGHIAQLHAKDVLATTVLQTCIRYESRKKTCKFCAIGQSLAAGRTIAHKTPAQLAEVAAAAVKLDGVKHMVMTTGTPAGKDRGAQVLADSAEAIRAAVDLPLQAQCEPPEDDAWHRRMKDAGIDSLGMHLEVVTPELRAEIMPGKAQVPLEKYFDSFAAAVDVFGWGQVSTYILAGLGDTPEAILEMSERLTAIGVYPFVVPFVPVSGTPLESHAAPTPAFMHSVLPPLAAMIRKAGMSAEDIKAGCGRCGACSALSAFEKFAPKEKALA
ncbi:radical SAM protein, MSMEG_0568 family [Roseivivax halotolerans]|uniref:Radical SAM protein, MSMEG_0568 family n=1 Tax=Roseivivax halotolerans TaxID=93684 RepID=A0A1I6A9B0_9RHOB|nr:MSMEG_0568 family radical SAM protein [Roseivivax halotolerans]SFQ65235.1 radical SAM protein, MSMEG_0568 family [Roseivivax halotolerans]